MNLDLKQINNLCTGVKLVAELESSNSDLRKFLTIQGYKYNEEGRVVGLKKILNKGIYEEILFELRCYEISSEYLDNNWDVTEDDLKTEIYYEDIKGIKALEEKLEKFLQNFSVLMPEWYCDNPL